MTEAEAAMIDDCKADIVQLTHAIIAVIEDMQCGRNVAANADVLVKLQERRSGIRVAMMQYNQGHS